MPSRFSSFLVSPSVEARQIRSTEQILNEKQKYVHSSCHLSFSVVCVPGYGYGYDSWTDFWCEIGECVFGVGLSYRATSTSIGSVTTSGSSNENGNGTTTSSQTVHVPAPKI